MSQPYRPLPEIPRVAWWRRHPLLLSALVACIASAGTNYAARRLAPSTVVHVHEYMAVGPERAIVLPAGWHESTEPEGTEGAFCFMGSSGGFCLDPPSVPSHAVHGGSVYLNAGAGADALPTTLPPLPDAGAVLSYTGVAMPRWSPP